MAPKGMGTGRTGLGAFGDLVWVAFIFRFQVYLILGQSQIPRFSHDLACSLPLRTVGLRDSPNMIHSI
jgi:hypothetical protein